MPLVLLLWTYQLLQHLTQARPVEINFNTLDNRLEDLQLQIGPYPILDISPALPQMHYVEKHCSVTQPKLVSPAELFLGFYNQFCPQNDTFCKTLSSVPIYYDSWTVLVGKDHPSSNALYFNVFGSGPFQFYQSRLQLEELVGLRVDQIQFFARGVDDMDPAEPFYSSSMKEFQVGLKLATENFVRVIRLNKPFEVAQEPYDNTVDIESHGWTLPSPQPPSVATLHKTVNLPATFGSRPISAFVRVVWSSGAPIFAYEQSQSESESTLLVLADDEASLALPLASVCHLRSPKTRFWDQPAPKPNITTPGVKSFTVEESFHLVGLQKTLGTANSTTGNNGVVAKVQLCKVFVVNMEMETNKTQIGMESVCQTIEHLVTNGSNQTGLLTNNTSSRGIDMMQDGRGGCVAVANQLVSANNSTRVVTSSAFWISYTNETVSETLFKQSEHFAGVTITDVTPESQLAEIQSAIETHDFLILGYGGSDYELVYRPSKYTARLKQSKKHFGKILFFAHSYRTRLTEVRPVAMISAGSKQSSPHAPVTQSNESFVRQLHADTINSLSSIISCTLDRQLMGKKSVLYYKVTTPSRELDLRISFGVDSEQSDFPLLLRILKIIVILAAATILIIGLKCFLKKCKRSGSAGVKSTVDQVLSQKPALNLPQNNQEKEEIQAGDSSQVMDSQRTADGDIHSAADSKEAAFFDQNYKFPDNGLRTPESAKSQHNFQFDSA